jgi:AraC-like DNA-binding protein
MDFLRLLLFLPATACFLGIALIFFVSRRTSTFWILATLSFILMLYFAADAIYVFPGRSTETVVYSHLVSIFSGPCVIPLFWLYFNQLYNHKRFRPVHFLWIVVPFSLFFSCLSLTGVMGQEQVAQFLQRLYTEGPGVAQEYKGQFEWDYFLWASLGYRIVVAVEFAAGFAYLVYFLIRERISIVSVWRYFRNGERTRVIELQLSTMILAAIYILSKVFFFKDIFDSYPWVGVAQSLLVTTWYMAFMFYSLFGEKKTVSFVESQHVMFYNYNDRIKGPVVEIMMEELLEECDFGMMVRLRKKLDEALNINSFKPQSSMETVKEKLRGPVAGTWDDSLMARFHLLMVRDRLFLQPSLSLGEVASRLHTNKTYISKLVNNTYGVSFPDFLNALRIDYAQEYLLSHREARQEDVAKASGFLSASTFNNIFKKVTGVTPKMWLASQ